MPTPFFTVVIPTYNRADLLPLAIESVLKQSFQDFEIIVVDNFSSDNTPQIIQQYKADDRIHYFRNEQNMERAYSRNVGLRNGKGLLLTLLDSDDLMYTDCLQDANQFHLDNPKLKVFHNLYEMVDQEGKPVQKVALSPLKNQYEQICQGNFFSCIGVFLHREVYKKFEFTEDLKMIGSEDYEIWFRVLAYNEAGRINKVNCGVREHLGRSVYSSMYENLEYQRRVLIETIKRDEQLNARYAPYIGYINSNYYFHEAMYALHKKQRPEAMKYFLLAAKEGKGFMFSKRFFAFLKNYFFNNQL